jgi:hypothetical protein
MTGCSTCLWSLVSSMGCRWASSARLPSSLCLFDPACCTCYLGRRHTFQFAAHLPSLVSLCINAALLAMDASLVHRMR